MTNKSVQINLVIELLLKWELSIQYHNSINLQDINILSEGLACNLLNYIYNLKLKNQNKLKNNFPGIDLGDTENKVAYQITSRIDAQKFRENLQTFVSEKYHQTYSNGFYFFILRHDKEKISFGKNKPSNIYSPFDEKKHIISLKDLLKEITDLYDSNYTKFECIIKLLKKEIDSISSFSAKDEEPSPTISFSFKKQFHLKDSDEYLAIFFQNVSRRIEEETEPFFEILIEEERVLLSEILELKKDFHNLKNQKEIADIKDILTYLNKTKDEVAFYIKSLLLYKKYSIYDYMKFDSFVTAFHEIIKDFWFTQIIFEKTCIERKISTVLKKEKSQKHKGSSKLVISDRNKTFQFNIFENQSAIESLFKKAYSSFDIDNFDHRIMSSFWEVEVSDLDTPQILEKVIPSFLHHLYHNSTNVEIRNSGLTSFLIEVG